MTYQPGGPPYYQQPYGQQPYGQYGSYAIGLLALAVVAVAALLFTTTTVRHALQDRRKPLVRV